MHDSITKVLPEQKNARNFNVFTSANVDQTHKPIFNNFSQNEKSQWLLMDDGNRI